jgi:hypothetical protein
VVLGTSDNEQVNGALTFGEPRLRSITAQGELFTLVSVPGIDPALGGPGKPTVPVLHRLIAVPQGADLRLSATPHVAQVLELNLYPVQPGAADAVDPDQQPAPETYANLPFEKDTKLYSSNAAYPPDVCSTSILGQFRDLVIAQLSCAAGQYNPVSDQLALFDEVRFDVDFVDGTGAFVTEASLSPFESAPTVWKGSVINNEAIERFVSEDPSTRICFGEELLVLTPPSFRAAADTLAAWKIDKGIDTSVVEVSDGPGGGPDGAQAIKDFIRDRYNSCIVRPSYILLMGDAEFIPPADYFATPFSTNTSSDYGYANIVPVRVPDP